MEKIIMLRKILTILLLALSCQLSLAQVATITVPFPPGGPNDIMGRAVQKYLQEKTGDTYIVVNRPGAEGRVGVRHVAGLPPDGRNLLVASVGTFVSVRFSKNPLGYDISDFDLIAPIAIIPFAVTVSSQSPIKTFKDFVAQTKVRAVNCGTVSAVGRLVGNYMKTRLDLQQLEIVTYKSIPDLAVAVMSNNIECTMEAWVSQLRNDKIRLLAAADPTLTSVPQIKEIMPELPNINQWFGVAIHKDTPDDLKRSLKDALRVIHKDNKFVETMQLAGLQVIPITSVTGNDFAEREYQFWKKILDRNPKILD